MTRWREENAWVKCDHSPEILLSNYQVLRWLGSLVVVLHRCHFGSCDLSQQSNPTGEDAIEEEGNRMSQGRKKMSCHREKGDDCLFNYKPYTLNRWQRVTLVMLRPLWSSLSSQWLINVWAKVWEMLQITPLANADSPWHQWKLSWREQVAILELSWR